MKIGKMEETSSADVSRDLVLEGINKGLDERANVSDSSENTFFASIGLLPRDCAMATAEIPEPRNDPYGLPPGWRRILVQRTTGASAGKFDVYIYSPDGRKHRSRTDLAAYLQKKGIHMDNLDKISFSLRNTGSQGDERRYSCPKKRPTNGSSSISPNTPQKKIRTDMQYDKESPVGKQAKGGIGGKLVVRMNFKTPKSKGRASIGEESSNSDLELSKKSAQDNVSYVRFEDCPEATIENSFQRVTPVKLNSRISNAVTEDAKENIQLDKHENESHLKRALEDPDADKILGDSQSCVVREGTRRMSHNSGCSKTVEIRSKSEQENKLRDDCDAKPSTVIAPKFADSSPISPCTRRRSQDTVDGASHYTNSEAEREDRAKMRVSDKDISRQLFSKGNSPTTRRMSRENQTAVADHELKSTNREIEGGSSKHRMLRRLSMDKVSPCSKHRSHDGPACAHPSGNGEPEIHNKKCRTDGDGNGTEMTAHTNFSESSPRTRSASLEITGRARQLIEVEAEHQKLASAERGKSADHEGNHNSDLIARRKFKDGAAKENASNEIDSGNVWDTTIISEVHCLRNRTPQRRSSAKIGQVSETVQFGGDVSSVTGDVAGPGLRQSRRLSEGRQMSPS